jgi:hypothetical protein
MIFDDEGEYLYQVWRMKLGEVPYRDFLTPQLPVFLYTGLAIMKAVGISLLGMRLAAVSMALATAAILYVAGRKHAGPLTGIFAMGLFLLHPDVFREMRIFRNESVFILLVTAGLVMATWTAGSGKRRNLAIAGILFGLATMSKLFGLLPAAGIGLWLLWDWWSRSRKPEALLGDAAALAMPLLATIMLLGVVFANIAPEFLDLVVGHHLAQGSQLPFAEVISSKLVLFQSYLALYPLLVLIALVSALIGFRVEDARGRWAWQFVTVLSFIVLSRQLGQRHFMYLLPTLALLAGWLLASALDGAYSRWGRVLSILALLVIVIPWMQLNLDRASWVDTQTQKVVDMIDERTERGSVILADDIGLAFYSRRPTTYSGAALSHGAVTSGQITGEQLISEIIQDDVRLVIVDESLLTGNHMVFLRDYPRFHRFLGMNFDYEGPIRRDYQELAIWSRNDDQEWQVDDVIDPQHKSGVRFGETINLLGYSLCTTDVKPGETLELTLFWESKGAAANYWSVFVHLVADDGSLIAQHDKVPYDGLYPPNQWWPGQIVDDEYEIRVPTSAPPGLYKLYVGMYDHLTGERLTLWSADGQSLENNQVALEVQIRVAHE